MKRLEKQKRKKGPGKKGGTKGLKVPFTLRGLKEKIKTLSEPKERRVKSPSFVFCPHSLSGFCPKNGEGRNLTVKQKLAIWIE